MELNGSGPYFVTVQSPEFEAAEARVTELTKEFGFNSAVQLLGRLIEEVEAMSVASRFSPDIPAHSTLPALPNLNPMLIGLSESDYKRWELRHAFEIIRSTILVLSGDFEQAMMDLEATKTESG